MSTTTRKYITADEEVGAIPNGWDVQCVGEANRIAFYPMNDENGTFEHPVFGLLPQPWELRKTIGALHYHYFNTSINEASDHGPRRVLRPASPPSGAINTRPAGMGELERNVIAQHPLHGEYTRLKTLDTGTGDIGGMNGGIYVVGSSTTGQLYVEKRYKTTSPFMQELVKSEIYQTRQLVHHAIIHYVDAYIEYNPFRASLYMEYCDRGTLKDLIVKYKKKKKASKQDRIPESFLWHTLISLADALAYLKTGRSFAAPELDKPDPTTWKPIVHRDIKPGNVFLRSRDSPTSQKPFYVLLSDFGLMDYESQDQGGGPEGACGTAEYHAPELTFDPYPSEEQRHFQARPHTGRSDVWAVACTLLCMCERDDLPHMDRECWPLRSRKALGRIAKLESLDITDVGIYSEYLARTISWAASSDPATRPDGEELIKEVLAQWDLWRSDPSWKEHVDVGGMLPSWATRKRTVTFTPLPLP
ncbi:Uu.00g105290.m01.CDS01 [Anthostomella pinea]|uniref:non-specific serine/threonine protein kinase n=1 Tax=Anthostomella pinea TaxID=933095 RepID=A0AAI8YFX2_9PEZI|nr:Uu.00g105290.m01.CDS01 [Anthostomella pinea]